MPRRLAPLLIFFYLVISYGQTQSPHSSQPSVKAVAVPNPNVFIPLKEWKRQRLQDIESRVRKAEEKRASPARRLFGKCKPRARLFALLFRIDICPPVQRESPHVVPQASPHDPYWISGKHAYGDVNYSAGLTPSPSPKEVLPAPRPAASVPVDEEATDAQPAEQTQSASAEPTVNIEQGDRPPASAEPDEITDKNYDASVGGPTLSISKALPKVLPNVIPNVGEIVKSIKEASLGYASPAELLPKALWPGRRTQNSTPNNTVNSTSQRANRKTTTGVAPPESKNAKAPQTDEKSSSGGFQDEGMLDAIVKHSTHSGVEEKPFNYASVDAGARVLAFSSEVVGAKNIIQNSDDKYLLAPCAGSGIAGSRWVDLELSEEIVLESVETGNFEYYSSSPRKVAVLGASSYPPKKWIVLGIFPFANVKTQQKFYIEKRGVTRYLRIIFAGKQGTEYYCPISTVRAFGKSLIADWKDVFEKPPTPRKSQGENGRVSKAKPDKEADKSKTGSRNSRQGDSKSPKNRNSCSGDSCANSIRESTISENPASADRDSATEDNQETLGIQKAETQRIESDKQPAANAQNKENLSTSGETSRGDVATGQERESELEDSHGEQEMSEESVNEEGPSRGSQTSDEEEEGEHVSEDDQVVIDALRSDTLSPVHGDDNIFRKVTRMLRLLELNQTLTNQYIDTQLAKFAVALNDAHAKSEKASDRVQAMQTRLEMSIMQLENQVKELATASFRRDVLICVLLVCLTFLLGSHWVLWTAVTGPRLYEEPLLRRASIDSESERVDRMLQTDDEITQISVLRLDGTSSEGPSPAGKKKKRKGRKMFSGETINGQYFSAKAAPPRNGSSSRIDRRSKSSFEILSVNGRRSLASSGGTFDVLKEVVEE